MSRDYKPRPKAKNAGSKRKSARGGTLMGLFIGLVIGVIFALVVAWYVNRTPIPFVSKGKTGVERPADKPEVASNGKDKGDKADKGEKGDKAADKPDTPPANTAGGPAPLPGKPGDKAVEHPRFDFYKILPAGEKGDGKTDKPADKTADKDKPAQPEKFYLQLGAFTNPSDADNLKAKVALMGLEASVQQVDNPEKGVMHRVRVGPYLGPEEMGNVRSQLAQNGIQATVVKIKPKPKTEVKAADAKVDAAKPADKAKP